MQDFYMARITILLISMRRNVASFIWPLSDAHHRQLLFFWSELIYYDVVMVCVADTHTGVTE